MSEMSENEEKAERVGTKPPARITIVEQVSYQPMDEEAVQFTSQFDRIVESKDNPVRRGPLEVTPNGPAKIESYWLDSWSILTVENVGKTDLRLYPFGLDLPVEVGYLPLPTGESIRIYVKDLSNVFVLVDSTEEVGRVKYTLYPS